MSHSQSCIICRLLVTLTILLLISLTGGLIASAAASSPIQESNTSNNVTEEAYVEPAPEPGDEYYEASADDGSWVSYINPRDEYRDPYLGDGSGKICVTLLNEAGEPIVGETIPETTVKIPTGESLEWHSRADPLAVQYPLSDQYDRPLDADQFGTAETLNQGDGYMDSHCIEFHGLSVTDQISYGKAELEGTYAERVTVVGYIQQNNSTWDSDVNPLEATTSYKETGGGWTYTESASHGQVTILLQLSPKDSDSNTNESQPKSNKSAGSGAVAIGFVIIVFISIALARSQR